MLRGGQNGPKSRSRRAMLGPCWRYVGTFFALGRFLFTSWAFLGRFLLFLVVFFAFWSVLGWILERSGTLQGEFGRPQSLIFRGFCACARLLCENAADVSKPQFFLGFSNVFGMPRASGTDTKTMKNRCRSLSHEPSHEERAKILCWAPPGSILKGFGFLPDTLWTALGGSWASLGRSWVPFGRLLGTSWASLGCSWVPPGCQMLPRTGSASILDRFWLDFASILEGSSVGFADNRWIYVMHL